MTKYYYDLHIHSVLSPCTDETMTVNNIVNMAKLKGLDMISITDHNCAKNCRVAAKLASLNDILFIPGIEVETIEGIHILCYFRTINELEHFSEMIYHKLPNIRNNKDLLGEQLIINEDDEVISQEERMLLNSTTLSLNELVKLVSDLSGISIAAHIDREAHSIITVLGFIPKALQIDGVEVKEDKLIDQYKRYRVIKNSDAHYIGLINERINYLELQEKSIDAFFNYWRTL